MKAQEKDAKRLLAPTHTSTPTPTPTHTHTHTQSVSVVRLANVRRHPLSMAVRLAGKKDAQNKSRSEQITRVVFSASLRLQFFYFLFFFCCCCVYSLLPTFALELLLAFANCTFQLSPFRLRS